MEKQVLIKKLLAEEPDYNQLALEGASGELLSDILRTDNDELKNRVVSLAVRVPALDPVPLLSFAYEHGGLSTKAVVIASLRKVNQEHLYDERIEKIISHALSQRESSILKFVITLIQERRLSSYIPRLQKLSEPDNEYVRNLIVECISTFR